jgi:Cys-tRNA(Pro) deacylase
LGVELASTIKTLVVELPEGRFIFLLLPGGKSVSMRNLARMLGVKSAELASERDAQRLTGYQVGGIGPFGSRTALDVYLDISAFEHEIVYINGGRRGLLLGLKPDDLLAATKAELLDIALSG